jgi:hypothetical protein
MATPNPGIITTSLGTTPSNLPSTVGTTGGAPTDPIGVALYLTQFVSAVNGWVAGAANAVNWLLGRAPGKNTLTSTSASLAYTVTSTSSVAIGLPISITPQTTGRIIVYVTLSLINTSSADGGTMVLRYGTGTAPTQGSAPTGTAFGSFFTTAGPGSGIFDNFSVSWPLTGLSVQTTYWIEPFFQVLSASFPVKVQNAYLTVVEV